MHYTVSFNSNYLQVGCVRKRSLQVTSPILIFFCTTSQWLVLQAVLLLLRDLLGHYILAAAFRLFHYFTLSTSSFSNTFLYLIFHESFEGLQNLGLYFVLGWSAVQKLIHKEIGIMTYLSPNRLRLMQHFSLNCFCHHWGYSLIPRTTPTRKETKIEFLHLRRHPTNMPLKNLFCSLFLWNLFCSLLDFLSNYFISSAFFSARLRLLQKMTSTLGSWVPLRLRWK